MKAKPRKEKPIFPMKAKIVLMCKDMIISGDGMVDGVKLTTGEYRFTGILTKNYDKK